MKRRFSTELAYVLGIVSIAWGVVLMEKADFGVSMVVAPAYLLYRWLSPAWGFFTFGMAEYCLQAVLLMTHEDISIPEDLPSCNEEICSYETE